MNRIVGRWGVDEDRKAAVAVVSYGMILEYYLVASYPKPRGASSPSPPSYLHNARNSPRKLCMIPKKRELSPVLP